MQVFCGVVLQNEMLFLLKGHVLLQILIVTLE